MEWDDTLVDKINQWETWIKTAFCAAERRYRFNQSLLEFYKEWMKSVRAEQLENGCIAVEWKKMDYVWLPARFEGDRGKEMSIRNIRR